MTKNIFATLGLLGLFLAIGLGLVAAFGGFADKALIAYAGNTPTSYQPSGKATKEDISQLKQSATDVGKTVKAGDLTWAITRAHAADDLSKAGPPPKPRYGNFVAVTFTVKNDSDKPVTLTPDALTVFSDDGYKFPPQAWVNGGYVPDPKNILFNEESILQPGATKEGQANFELPQGTSASLLQLGDEDPNSDNEKYVDLGLSSTQPPNPPPGGGGLP